ncbi:MAG: T9SS type A sorting domain-containing protein [Chitinophagaceae bacterium]|nr:MAG: T9SS type A sorting domain-containing protein [Chitinophagaceae bacterium]
MKPVNTTVRLIILITLLSAVQFSARAQSCTPAGDQLTYGTGNVWNGYAYTGIAFDNYRGYINVGTAASMHFDHNFGGSAVNFSTAGCPVYTENFSVRFKLRKTFTAQNIQFTIGGDDGFRFSIDGGTTWLINRWNDQGYTTASAIVYLNGTHDLVLEYYERGGDNRVSFSTAAGSVCTGAGNPLEYGTNNVWRGYIYQGTNLEAYAGFITKGSVGDANFDENFGGDNVMMNGISCPIATTNFSARFRLTKYFATGSYLFTVGGDDGYRLSLDGGNTWAINRWVDQSYSTTSVTLNLSGTYNIVLDYYENQGGNRLTFAVSGNLVLPVKLTAFNATPVANDKVRINWSAASQQNFNKFIVQSATDGRNFNNIGEVNGAPDSVSANHYTFYDRPVSTGKIYYRLAMVDLDATVKYSPVVTVSLIQVEAARIYPSLVVNRQINLEAAVAAPGATVELYDLNGRRLYSRLVNITYGKQALPADITNNTAKGNYLVRVISQQSIIASQRIMIP